MNTKKGTLLWVDLEMTGLSPAKDRIVEVAAIVTGWDLEPIDTFTAVAKVDEELMKERMTGDFWERKSESRDALMKQNESGEPVEVVEKKMLDFLKKNCINKGKIILAGNSIHQDRKFIDREMPKVSKKLHYRMLDVSAWKVYFENALSLRFVKPENHRALDDIMGSIEELKYYRGFLNVDGTCGGFCGKSEGIPVEINLEIATGTTEESEVSEEEEE